MADENKPENVEETGDIDFGKKKKKKNKLKDILKDEEEQTTTTTTPAAAATTTSQVTEKLEDLSLNQQAAPASDATTAAAADEEDFSKLKKKKKGVKFDESTTTEASVDFAPNTNVASGNETMADFQGNDRDYTYDVLLERVFKIMNPVNPSVSSSAGRFIMKPPQVARVGTKKTSFTNFGEICRLLNREEKHLLNFLLAELGTSGSTDINTQLTIKGRFSQQQIESVLRRYIKEYIMCHTCRSPNTQLVKEERLFFLQCKSCGSRPSVASIKSGFQAQVGKRAAQRAKAS